MLCNLFNVISLQEPNSSLNYSLDGIAKQELDQKPSWMQIIYSQYQPIISQVSLLFKGHSKITEQEKEYLDGDFCSNFIDCFKQVYQMNDSQENEIPDLVRSIFKSIAGGIRVEIPPELKAPV